MKSVSLFGQGICVTGSSGFVGSHFCRLLSAQANKTGDRCLTIPLDIRDRDEVSSASHEFKPHTVVHLVGHGTVSRPLSESADLLSSTVGGILNVLELIRPQRFILISSCAVYGNLTHGKAHPRETRPSPLSLYGLSKLAGELALARWAEETGNCGLVLRVGNILGRGGGGLIAYLVKHALSDSSRQQPARMRDQGRIVRDYVPVDTVGRALSGCLRLALTPGTVRHLNVGSGIGLTNGHIGEFVCSTLRRHGHRLRIDWSDPIGPGEARRIVLDVAETEEQLSLAPPGEASILQSARDSVLYLLDPTGDEISYRESQDPEALQRRVEVS